ncbi:MAG: SDR family oxidoreductase, partial [Alphaproteobacteria bacterium]|nr:SDR family oxidoreductase [Alphaproteobacteria bacterium]
LDLAQAGYVVAVHYNRSDRAAEEAVAQIRAAGGRAESFRADLADAEAVDRLVPQVMSRLGLVSVLVNNASIFEYETALTATGASWDRHLDINLRAPFFLAQAFARALPENRQGNVVNLLDQRVWRLTPHFTSYTVSKIGLWGLTQTLAMALAPRIRVNAIGPGPALKNVMQSEEDFAQQCAAMPLGRGTTTAEICAALRYILDAPAMTGQMIALDGGQHLEWRTQDKRRIQD